MMSAAEPWLTESRQVVGGADIDESSPSQALLQGTVFRESRTILREDFFFSGLRKHCAAEAGVVIKLVLRVRESDVALECVRRSVGAPTPHACQGNGSNYFEDLFAR
jgi:hypothetical protein